MTKMQQFGGIQENKLLLLLLLHEFEFEINLSSQGLQKISFVSSYSSKNKIMSGNVSELLILRLTHLYVSGFCNITSII